jgi:5-methylcytosine-specific restriction endonuclease McrBC GTP-binding regulatory subunit McrB
LALRAKPFVILAGISGTGKTQLPRKFAAALGFSKEQVIQLPVRPDWTDSSDLLGYTSLDGNFIPKDLTLAIQKAMANPNKPYFFILDEMNLASVYSDESEPPIPVQSGPLVEVFFLDDLNVIQRY